mgnify:CR=1 FL=1
MKLLRYGFLALALVPAAARVGVTETALGAARPGLVDRGPALRVRMLSGVLASASLEAEELTSTSYRHRAGSFSSAAAAGAAPASSGSSSGSGISSFS